MGGSGSPAPGSGGRAEAEGDAPRPGAEEPAGGGAGPTIADIGGPVIAGTAGAVSGLLLDSLLSLLADPKDAGGGGSPGALRCPTPSDSERFRPV